MKYYPNAHQRIFESSQRAAKDQCLFLVPDIGNAYDENAVMLSDGKGKLGHVPRAAAPLVKRAIKNLQKFAEPIEGSKYLDQVLVVRCNKIAASYLEYATQFEVQPIGFVHERIARKFAETF